MDYTKIVQEDDYIAHHGIKGQKWGFRRYQNPDGSLTEEGRLRYAVKEAKIKAKAEKATAKAQVKSAKLAVKAEKAAAKNLKRQEKTLKLEMKKLKKTDQDAAGKAFGEQFAAAFGKGFGQRFGEGIGSTMGDWQGWKKLHNEKYGLKTTRLEKELSKKKYNKGYEYKKLESEMAKNNAEILKQKAAWRDAYAKYIKNYNDARKTEIDYRKYLDHLKANGGNP